MKILILLSLLCTGYCQALNCTYPVQNIIGANEHRIQHPESVRLLKMLLSTKSVPTTVDYQEVYSDFPINTDYLLDKETLSSLYMANTVMVKTDMYGMKQIVIYPVLDINQGYVSGFLILGYKKPIVNNYGYYTGLELIGSYLSQVLTCK